MVQQHFHLIAFRRPPLDRLHPESQEAWPKSCVRKDAAVEKEGRRGIG
jgi:hypothetical protein